jgi:hypothetical protein
MSLPAPLRQLAAGPIFIVGCARSGTTWVYDIFTAHPQVAGVLESWIFSAGLGMGIFLKDSHWKAGGAEGPTGIGQLMSREELTEEMRTISARWLSRALRPKDRYLVEKTPGHIYTIDAIAAVYPEARFVHVLRDGRDVVVSMRAASTSWATSWERERTVDGASRIWWEAVRRARHVGAQLPGRFLEVRFEALKSDPFGSYRRLFDFCSIPYDDGFLERVHRETAFEHRSSGGEDRFRRSGRVGEWRERFTHRDALAFARATGTALQETGYEQDRFWWAKRGRWR